MDDDLIVRYDDPQDVVVENCNTVLEKYGLKFEYDDTGSISGFIKYNLVKVLLPNTIGIRDKMN